jgi:two-component system chemotaxis sensor kinase CheA
MNALLEQFLPEARECLQSISETLIQLEQSPDDADLMNNLFRYVHTLKGNSSLFDFPEMTRVLHAGEDLMDAVRHGQLAYSRALADQLLGAMDFVGLLCDEVQETDRIGSSHIGVSVRLVTDLRVFMSLHISPNVSKLLIADGCPSSYEQCEVAVPTARPPAVPTIWRRRKTDLPASTATSYSVSDPVVDLSVDNVFSSLTDIFESQRQILIRCDAQSWRTDLVLGVAKTLINCSRAIGDDQACVDVDAALAVSLAAGSNAALMDWLVTRLNKPSSNVLSQSVGADRAAVGKLQIENSSAQAVLQMMQKNKIFKHPPVSVADDQSVESPPDDHRLDDSDAVVFKRRRYENEQKNIKVEQCKIELLMNLIGEIVVLKNALPYLAQRAEVQYAQRELAREINEHYAAISRIAEDLQNAIMQVRMTPVSNVFQRFPRLVRDLSFKLGKKVQLVVRGEETEVDKDIIESLVDPLMHILRNSLDHGLELPDVRCAAGKSEVGTLTIHSVQEAGRILIEISDDGKGINPATIKHKAFEKGLIDAATFDRISNSAAIDLVFLQGFSTTETVSDLSGRGMGMDVVRTAVENVNGSIMLESVVGQGTLIRIALPITIAMTKIMTIASNDQVFGIPIEYLVATVRVCVTSIFSIKSSQAIVWNGLTLKLKSLNTMLGIDAESIVNDDHEIAVLVVRVDANFVGIIVDNFHGTLDVIQKPLSGVFAGLSAYSGSALMGDGSVLMVLNVSDFVQCR